MQAVNYQQLMSRTDNLLGRIGTLDGQRTNLRGALDQSRLEMTTLQATISLLQFVANEIARETEEETAKLLSLALQETFFDQQLGLEVVRDTYRGHPGVTFKVCDEMKGAKGDPMDSFGGGPASLLGLLLQVLSTLRQPNMAKILVLDEPVVQISEAYHKTAGQLIRRLCEPPPTGLGFKILMVTHSETLAEQAHVRYQADMSEDGASLALSRVEQRSDESNGDE